MDRDEDDERAATSEMRHYRKDSFLWYQRVTASNGEDLGQMHLPAKTLALGPLHSMAGTNLA